MQLTAAAVTPPAEHAARRPAGAADAAAADADVRHHEGKTMCTRTMLFPVGLVLLLSVVSLTIADDSLDRRMRAVAPDSVDCGRTEPGAEGRRAVLNCVQSHVEAGTAFRARFDNTCLDNICAWGLFRDKSSGALQILSYDPKGCSSNDTDVWCGTFGEVPCKNPMCGCKQEECRFSAQATGSEA